MEKRDCGCDGSGVLTCAQDGHPNCGREYEVQVPVVGLGEFDLDTMTYRTERHASYHPCRCSWAKDVQERFPPEVKR